MNSSRNIFKQSEAIKDDPLAASLVSEERSTEGSSFSQWLDGQLAQLVERFSMDITPNSLRNSLRRKG